MTFMQWTANDGGDGVKTVVASAGGPTLSNSHYTSPSSIRRTMDRLVTISDDKPRRYVAVGAWIIWDNTTDKFFNDLEYLPEWKEPS
jgi:hypothetical protein